MCRALLPKRLIKNVMGSAACRVATKFHSNLSKLCCILNRLVVVTVELTFEKFYLREALHHVAPTLFPWREPQKGHSRSSGFKCVWMCVDMCNYIYVYVCLYRNALIYVFACVYSYTPRCAALYSALKRDPEGWLSLVCVHIYKLYTIVLTYVSTYI